MCLFRGAGMRGLNEVLRAKQQEPHSLRMACQGVEEVYLASFRKASREFWRDYDRRVRD